MRPPPLPSGPPTGQAGRDFRREADRALAAGDSAGAIAAFQTLITASAGDAFAHGQLAHLFERAHDLPAARRHAEAALAGDPAQAVARVALARVAIREGDFAAAQGAALPLTGAEGASVNDRSVAWGLVGDARDRLGDARGAFAAFRAANDLALERHKRLRDAHGDLFHPDGVAAMTAFVATTNVATWRKPGPFATPAPAFLVGFPRSGTTLLDQVLSSHPAIRCLEEKDYLAQALHQVFKRPEQLVGMGRLSDHEIGVIRGAYWRLAGRSEGVVVDKMPLNIVVLPLIRAVFPDAKIILALRDPRDVVLSCFQQRFGMNVAMAQMLELDRAAAYYDGVMTLMETCRFRLAMDFHTVRYEDVVENLEGEARGLAAFLDLPFDPAMLDYRRTALARDINTPSARQVIQPLYNRSIGRWRAYAEDMAPVLPGLARWAERLGYPI